MKKLLSFLLAFTFTLYSSSLAVGDTKATKKSLLVIDDDSGYFFAKVENIGDAPIGLDNGNLAIFSTDDELILSDSYVSALPNYVILEPGDYVYVRDYLWDDALATPVGDCKFSVPAYKRATPIKKIPCEATMDISKSNGYYNYIFVTCKNSENTLLDNIYISAALYDDKDNLIFAQGVSLSNISIHPDSTITLKVPIDYDLIEYYEKNLITPTSVDAMIIIENE